MQWIILKDIINATGGEVREPFTKPGQGVVGKSNVKSVTPETFCLNRPGVHEFRLLDDDKNPYFEGVCVGLDDADGDQAFAPLDVIGEGYGCTEMQYRAPGAQEWVQL